MAVARPAQAIRIAGGTPYAQFIPQGGGASGIGGARPLARGDVSRNRTAGQVAPAPVVSKPPTTPTTAQTVSDTLGAAFGTASDIATAGFNADVQRARTQADVNIAQINADASVQVARINAASGTGGTSGTTAPPPLEENKTAGSGEKPPVVSPQSWTSDPVKVVAVSVGGLLVAGGIVYGISRLVKKGRK